MKFYELYSSRHSDNLQPDVYEYDWFPDSFRNRFLFIFGKYLDYLERSSVFNCSYNAENAISRNFCNEIGLQFDDGCIFINNRHYGLKEFLQGCDDEVFLDFVDYFFGFCLSEDCDFSYFSFIDEDFHDDLIEELNYRFKQDNLGYEFINGQIVKKTNELIHATAVKPVLYLLQSEKFEGPNEEFLKAFEFYRHDDYKNAVLYSSKAFESLLKCICECKGYHYNPTSDSCSKLLNNLKTNSFYPDYLDSQLNGIETCLRGVPTLRNKIAGHGQGSEVVYIPESYARYALNMVASSMLFLFDLYYESSE